MSQRLLALQAAQHCQHTHERETTGIESHSITGTHNHAFLVRIFVRMGLAGLVRTHNVHDRKSKTWIAPVVHPHQSSSPLTACDHRRSHRPSSWLKFSYILRLRPLSRDAILKWFVSRIYLAAVTLLMLTNSPNSLSISHHAEYPAWFHKKCIFPFF